MARAGHQSPGEDKGKAGVEGSYGSAELHTAGLHGAKRSREAGCRVVHTAQAEVKQRRPLGTVTTLQV